MSGCECKPVRAQPQIMTAHYVSERTVVNQWIPFRKIVGGHYLWLRPSGLAFAAAHLRRINPFAVT